MSTVKKVWITKHDGGMVDISLRSEHVQPIGMRVKVSEKVIGEPTSMHRVVVGLLSVDDLEMIVEAIDEYLLKLDRLEGA